MTTFDPIEFATREIRPLLQQLCELSLTDGIEEQHAYFSMLLAHLDAAKDEGGLADTFVNLSSAAFLGFDYAPDTAIVLDLVLERAELLAETLSIEDCERH